MRILSTALCAVALLGGVAAAAPAIAAPAQVIVRGATPILPPSGYGFSPGGDYANDPAYIYGDPLDRYYDPAGKIPDSRYYGPPAVDLALARTLDNNHESILGHMLHCQASYPTYNPATNFYRGRHGIPQTCYR